MCLYTYHFDLVPTCQLKIKSIFLYTKTFGVPNIMHEEEELGLLLQPRPGTLNRESEGFYS